LTQLIVKVKLQVIDNNVFQYRKCLSFYLFNDFAFNWNDVVGI